MCTVKKRTRYPPPKKHPIECKSSGTGTYPCRMYSSSQTPLCPKQKNIPRVRQEDKKHTKAVPVQRTGTLSARSTGRFQCSQHCKSKGIRYEFYFSFLKGIRDILFISKGIRVKILILKGVRVRLFIFKRIPG